MSPLFYLSYGLAIIAVIVVPFLVGWAIRRSWCVSWRVFLWGALVFFIAQVAFRIPIVRLIHAVTGWTSVGNAATESIAHLAALALTAGLCEEVGRWLGYKTIFRGKADRASGLMYGLGHGWLECLVIAGSMILIVITFRSMASLDLSAVEFSPAQLSVIRQAHSLWLPIAGAFERMAMLPIHMVFSLLVLQSFRSGKARWLVGAVILHAVVNFGISMVIRFSGLMYGEITAAAISLISIYAILRLMRRDQTDSRSLPSPAGTITLTG